jgi:hypothetical protein
MTRPTAAPAHFPYAHRTLEQIADDRLLRQIVPAAIRRSATHLYDLHSAPPCASEAPGVAQTASGVVL